jgi:hypothetical protein
MHNYNGCNNPRSAIFPHQCSGFLVLTDNIPGMIVCKKNNESKDFLRGEGGCTVVSHINMCTVVSHINMCTVVSHINMGTVVSYINMRTVVSRINMRTVVSHINMRTAVSHINMCTVVSHVNQVWNESNVIFLECTGSTKLPILIITLQS